MKIAENFSFITKKIFFLFLFSTVQLFGQSENCKTRLSESVNSYSRITSPVISANGKFLFIDRKEHPDNAGGVRDVDDIWVSEKNSFGWSELKNVMDLNSTGSSVLFSLSPDGSRALMYDASRKNFSGFFIAHKSKSGWRILDELRIKNFENTSTNFYGFLNADESVLFLGIENKNSTGKLDLFVSFHEENFSYSEPKNLGQVINTTAIEGAPFLALDNKTLYFSSDGKNGHGKSDLYMSRRLDNSWQNWSPPVNLGNIINTREEENGICLSRLGDTAYVVSWDSVAGRAGVYTVCLPQDLQPWPYILLSGQIVASNFSLEQIMDTKLSSAEIYTDKDSVVFRVDAKKNFFVNEENSFLIPLSGPTADNDKFIVKEQVLEVQGFYPEYFQIQAILRGKKADLRVLRKNITSREIFHDIIFPTEQPQQVDTQISPVKEISSKPNAIYHFETKQFVASEEEKKSLVEQITRLENFTARKFLIVGHTDDIGGKSYNLALSRRRAQSAQQELLKLGIPRKNISIEGKGFSQLVRNEKTPDARAFNRRVEVFLLKD